jgi:hypothetical protein
VKRSVVVYDLVVETKKFLVVKRRDRVADGYSAIYIK